MEHTNFRVKLSLLTPFSLSAPLTLDALLSAAVANATGLEGDATLPHIPLAQRDGIFLGSSLFLPPRFRHVPVGRVMALRGERDASVHVFRPNGNKYVDIYTDKGKKYANKLSLYPGYQASAAFFYGVGDADRVAYLLDNFILGIGKRCNGGAGEIAAVSVTEVAEDFSWKTADGMPARPLPIDIWRKIGGDPTAPTMPLAVTLPYWQTKKVEAVFPTRMSM